MTKIKSFYKLAKCPVSLLSSMSAVTGFVLARGIQLRGLLPFFCAIFLLATGTAILNQYQERTTDAMMLRTRNRPIPNGELKAGAALAIAISAIVIGFALLGVFFGAVPVWLGICSVVLYNGLYTFLKKKTAFASIPGAAAGALPPVMGFTAAGGTLGDPLVLWLLTFFYIWQIPHFWLLMGIHGDDYRRANFPSFQGKFEPRGLGCVIFNWIVATGCVALLFPLFGELKHSFIVIILLFLVLWTGWRVMPLTRKHLDVVPVFRRAFINVNQFVLITMVLFIIDRGI